MPYPARKTAQFFAFFGVFHRVINKNTCFCGKVDLCLAKRTFYPVFGAVIHKELLILSTYPPIRALNLSFFAPVYAEK